MQSSFNNLRPQKERETKRSLQAVGKNFPQMIRRFAERATLTFS